MAQTPQTDALAQERIYHPSPNEAQFTLRAIVTGCIIGGVVGAMNITIGLKIGWSFGGSIISAILGFAVWAMLAPMFRARPYGVLETNITQTTGSAAGAMASAGGLLAPIPALAMLGDESIVMNYLEMTLWCLGVGYLGVFFAVPLRRQMVVVEKLRFPSGTATAETIVSIFAEGAEAMRKARVLLIWAVIAMAFILLKYQHWFAFLGWEAASYEGWRAFAGAIERPPFHVWLASLTQWSEQNFTALNWPLAILAGGLTTAAAWGFVLLISPSMTGAGLLIGPRIGISLLAGAIVSWGIMGPIAVRNGWTAEGLANIRDWILWPGVAIMVADSLAALALSWRTILNTFRRTPAGEVGAVMEPEDQRVPNIWWLGGLAAGSTLAIIVAWWVFSIPPWITVLAIALSSVLAMIAVRSTGETDINPVGGMGKVTQLAFAGNPMVTNLMAASITGAGASQAGDMMHDLKAGRMLGASPRKQILSQCIGITAGVMVVVPAYWLLRKVVEGNGSSIGAMDGEYPAPAAHAWRGVAVVLSEGFDALPPNAGWAILIGLILGTLMPLVRKLFPKFAPYSPSGLAFGIAFIVPAMYPIAMFLGSMLLVAWRNWKPIQHKALVFAVASGLIAGEGVTNLAVALIDLARQTWWIP
ncbi:MAG TPA: OPT family oligopeptide transporter [Phycisphaerales bacterium]|nr:OPT family oligopeptide transporter [Phycisphaerales bacterium]